jgi:mRNA interferase RelE/StbE
MIVKIDKSFEKDTREITDKRIRTKIADIIELCKQSESLNQIRNIKKLVTFDNYYRIKIGRYRLGIYYKNNTIYFIRCLSRKDIYRYFP